MANVDEELQNSVDEALTALGNSGKQVIYYHLGRQFGMTMIMRDPKAFHEVLEGIFGPGAATLERIIARKACERLGIPVPEGEDFVANIQSIRENLSSPEVHAPAMRSSGGIKHGF